MLSEVLDFRTSEAQASARAMTAALDGTEKKLQGTQQAASQAEKSFDSMDSKTERVGRSFGKLANLIGSVSPEAAALTKELGVGVQALEVFTMGSSGLVAILGPLVSTLAVAAVAWRSVGEEERIAAAAGEQVKAIHEGMGPVLESTAKATIALRVAMGELTEAEGRQQQEALQRLQTWQGATAEARARITELKREQQSVTTQIVDGLSAISFGLGGAVLDGLTTTSQEMRQEMRALQEGVDAATEDLRENRDVTNTLADAQERSERSTKAHAAAVREETAALRQQQEQKEKFLAGMGKQETRLGLALDQTAALQPALNDLNASMEAWATDFINNYLRESFAAEQTATRGALRGSLAAGRSQAFGGLVGLAGGDAAGLGGVLGGLGTSLAGRATFLGQTGGGLAGGMGAGLLGAGLTGAAGLLGPAAMLAGIGGMGAGGVKDKLFSFKDDLIAGMEELPEIIGEVIPEFAAALATEIPMALVMALPDILEAVLRAILPGWLEDQVLGSEGGAGLTSPEQVAQWKMQQTILRGTDAATQAQISMQAAALSGEAPGGVARTVRSLLLGRTAGRLLEESNPVRRLRPGGMGPTVVQNINAIAADGGAIYTAGREMSRLYGSSFGLRPGGLP